MIIEPILILLEFKEKTGKYPKDIEDLKGWEELN